MIVFDLQRPINRYNVDNDYNYSEELVESFISKSNGGISVFIACTEPIKICCRASLVLAGQFWQTPPELKGASFAPAPTLVAIQT
jgi:hypothetical protein